MEILPDELIVKILKDGIRRREDVPLFSTISRINKRCNTYMRQVLSDRWNFVEMLCTNQKKYTEDDNTLLTEQWDVNQNTVCTYFTQCVDPLSAMILIHYDTLQRMFETRNNTDTKHKTIGKFMSGIVDSITKNKRFRRHVRAVIGTCINCGLRCEHTVLCLVQNFGKYFVNFVDSEDVIIPNRIESGISVLFTSMLAFSSKKLFDYIYDDYHDISNKWMSYWTQKLRNFCFVETDQDVRLLRPFINIAELFKDVGRHGKTDWAIMMFVEGGCTVDRIPNRYLFHSIIQHYTYPKDILSLLQNSCYIDDLDKLLSKEHNPELSDYDLECIYEMICYTCLPYVKMFEECHIRYIARKNTGEIARFSEGENEPDGIIIDINFVEYYYGSYIKVIFKMLKLRNDKFPSILTRYMTQYKAINREYIDLEFLDKIPEERLVAYCRSLTNDIMLAFDLSTVEVNGRQIYTIKYHNDGGKYKFYVIRPDGEDEMNKIVTKRTRTDTTIAEGVSSRDDVRGEDGDSTTDEIRPLIPKPSY